MSSILFCFTHLFPIMGFGFDIIQWKMQEKNNGGTNLIGSLIIQVIIIFCIIQFRYNGSFDRFWNDLMEHPLIGLLGIISYIGIIVYCVGKKGEN